MCGICPKISCPAIGSIVLTITSQVTGCLLIVLMSIHFMYSAILWLVSLKIINFFVKLRKSFTETSQLIQTAYWHEVCSRWRCHEWFERFKEGKWSELTIVLDDYFFLLQESWSSWLLSTRSNKALKPLRVWRKRPETLRKKWWQFFHNYHLVWPLSTLFFISQTQIPSKARRLDPMEVIKQKTLEELKRIPAEAFSTLLPTVEPSLAEVYN